MLFHNYIETFIIFSSMILGIFIYKVPLAINTCIVSILPKSFYIADTYNIMFDLVYSYSAYGLLLFYISKKIPQTFESLGYTYSNLPTHPYIYLLFKLSFVLLVVPMLFVTQYMKLLFNIPMYSLYLSQLVYSFLDSDKHMFKNNIEFYNSNTLVLNAVSGVYSILVSIIFKQFSLIFFIISTLITVPILIKSPYITSGKSHINCFYIPERVLSKILLIWNLHLSLIL